MNTYCCFITEKISAIEIKFKKMKIYSDTNEYNDKSTVVTIGMFDGVHSGHKKLLDHVIQVSENESLISSVVTFWPHPRMVLKKGDSGNLQFITTIDEKVRLISSQGIEQIFMLAFTMEIANLTAEEFVVSVLIEKLKMKHLVVGFNHRFGKDRMHKYEDYKKLAEKYNFNISRVEAAYDEGDAISSTVIRNFLKVGNIPEANKMLGYEFNVFGTVKGGQKLGRKLGYPTANIQPNESYKLIPSKGVYACYLDVIGKRYQGMLNVGVRPTVTSNKEEITIEVHILDFHQDIYSEEVLVTFIEKIREEKKFESLDALKEQLRKDENTVRALFSNNTVI